MIGFWLRPLVFNFIGGVGDFEDVGARDGIAEPGQGGQAVDVVVEVQERAVTDGRSGVTLGRLGQGFVAVAIVTVFVLLLVVAVGHHRRGGADDLIDRIDVPGAGVVGRSLEHGFDGRNVARAAEGVA